MGEGVSIGKGEEGGGGAAHIHGLLLDTAVGSQIDYNHDTEDTPLHQLPLRSITPAILLLPSSTCTHLNLNLT